MTVRARRDDRGDSPKAGEVLCPRCHRPVAWLRRMGGRLEVIEVEAGPVGALPPSSRAAIAEALGEVPGDAAIRMRFWTRVDPGHTYPMTCGPRCGPLEVTGEALAVGGKIRARRAAPR